MNASSTDLSRQTHPEQPALLDAVLDCLPHGLSHFNAQDELVLANPQFRAIYGLPKEAVNAGIHRDELLGFIRSGELSEALLRVTESRSDSSDATHLWQTNDGRTISISCETLDDGGYVVLHEIVTMNSSQAEYQQLALRDPLTSLLNRAGFNQALEHHLERSNTTGEEIALLFMDLDRFKPVNDTFGHLVGDKMLIEVAERIRKVVRKDDVIGRLGGDEFALLHVGSSQAGGSRSLAKRVIHSISQPFEVDGNSLNIGISIGVAVAPFDANDNVNLIKNADLALYRAKENGRNLLRYFEPEMDNQMQLRRSLEIELRNALKNDEFEILYQPVMDFEANRIVSAEALVRWRHPQLGLVSPADFVPLSEDTGLIVPIGNWVLHQACQDAVGWSNDMRVAVNISSVQLRNRALVATVMEALETTGLSPERLELEITETSLIADAELTISILTELRKNGVKVAMDDFGTGYSSINYLRRFPFDKIKIDRSFVSGTHENSEAAALVRMIASLGVCLAVTTTAEGVETTDEMEMVRKAGCSQIQGYLLSKPISNAEVLEMIS